MEDDDPLGDVLTHTEDPLLSLSEVARRLGKSPQTIGRWCDDGLLQIQRMPNGLRSVRQSELRQFLGGSQLAASVNRFSE